MNRGRGDSLPWCITLDNSKGISRLRFWAKKRRVNGINDLPVFMHQGTAAAPTKMTSGTTSHSLARPVTNARTGPHACQTMATSSSAAKGACQGRSARSVPANPSVPACRSQKRIGKRL